MTFSPENVARFAAAERVEKLPGCSLRPPQRSPAVPQFEG
jgi:hypothetical protein